MWKKYVFMASCLACLSYSLESKAHEGGHDAPASTQTTEHSSDQLRIWKDLSRNKEIKASFLSFDQKNLVLETADSKIVKIAFDHLSKPDRDFVNQKIALLTNMNHFIDDLPETPTPASGNIPLTLLLLGSGFGLLIFKLNTPRRRKIAFMASSLPLVYLACTPANEVTDVNKQVIQSDRSLLEKAFGVFKETVSTRSDERYFYVESNGLPEHNMMVGIKSWQQQVPLDQAYTGTNAWSIPLQPVLSETPVSTKNNFFRGGIGVAINGIPIFNALNNRGDDAFLVGELDQWGGHCGRADDYHYHTAPLHLEAQLSADTPIAYALDGFAVYGSKEPDGSVMSPLDENNGHFDLAGSYHYHGTPTYPYMIGKMRGEVTKSADDEITPQPRTMGIRDFLQPLNGAEITGFEATGDKAYSLEYTVNQQKNNVNYHWDDSGQYTFQFVSADGTSKTETYQRR